MLPDIIFISFRIQQNPASNKQNPDILLQSLYRNNFSVHNVDYGRSNMTKYRQEDKIPVPRKRLFVLIDGRFVIQWEENRVQDLLTGRYAPFSNDDFGNAITDYELNQLQNSGVVADYDDHLIYLQPNVSSTVATGPGRTYYLNTTLHKTRVDEVRDVIASDENAQEFSVRTQEIFVIIRGHSGMAYHNFDDAERRTRASRCRFHHESEQRRATAAESAGSG